MLEKRLPVLATQRQRFCLPKIVGKTKHIKSGKLCLTRKVCPSAYLSNTDISVFERQKLHMCARLKKLIVVVHLVAAWSRNFSSGKSQGKQVN